jgi:hypothetical protein
MGRTVPASVLGSVEFGEGTDTDVFAEVDVTGNGGWTSVSEATERGGERWGMGKGETHSDSAG